MNTTETNLIFEAYAKSKPLNEGQFWGQNKMVDEMRADEERRGMVRLKKEPKPGQYHGKTVHKSKVQALLDDGWKLDKVSEDAEDYGTAFEDLPLEDLFDTALEAVDKGHGLIESLMLAGADGSNIDELFELFKEYVAEQQKEFGSPEDNENFTTEGTITGKREKFMNTTETNLIYERYTQTFIKNNNDISVLEQLAIFKENHPEFSVQLSPIWNEMSEITEELGKFDIEKDDIKELEIYINDLNGVFNKLESFVHNNPQTEQELSPILDKFEDAIEEFDGHYSGGHLNQDELYGIVGRFASANE